MRPLGIHHVNITVGEMEAARTFYVDHLGMTERADRPVFEFDGAWLDLGGQQVHLVLNASLTTTTSQDHFAIAVGDIDGCIAELRSFGHRVSDAMGVNAARQAFLRDPWGNLIELQQPG
jgi:glyoxylase I family protein